MVLKNKLKKMWMMKILSLENAIRHGESFVITLDNFFSKAIQSNTQNFTKQNRGVIGWDYQR